MLTKGKGTKGANETNNDFRLEAAGCHVLFGRVLGTLAVSRAFGDIEFKHPYNRAAQDYVSPVPSVAEARLNVNLKITY